MDFYQIRERFGKNGSIEVYPDFIVGRSKDLMVRGGSFYAVWDEERGFWSTDEYDLRRLVDDELSKYRDNLATKTDATVSVKLLRDFSTMSWQTYRNYVARLSDNAEELDASLTFLNDKVKKKDYRTKHLSYALKKGSIDAYEELISTLYELEERAKIEWAIGAVLSGDSKQTQKFLVFYGETGTGKGTMLKIINSLFDGYTTTFDAKALTSSSNGFSTEAFRGNPIVAIQYDGDLSGIEDNTKLNAIVSHEPMTINEKYKPSYTSRSNCFLFMGTNKPVRISDAKSGLIRRLIDVRPSGNKVPSTRYNELMSQIEFELGAIAYHCLEVYKAMGKNYYGSYRPLDMMLQTDTFFNFVEFNYPVFLEQDGVTLSQAFTMYKTYCEDALAPFKLQRHKFREELKNYFRDFSDMTRIDGKQLRSYYSGFRKEKFANEELKEISEPISKWLIFDVQESYFDKELGNLCAQYGSIKETPKEKWSEVKTKLSELDTKLLHFVKLEPDHIVIDFDIADSSGQKSLEKNILAASTWPPTYAELSKSGKGIHLHYIYQGDASQLSRLFSEGIEVKVSVGNSSLRRKLTKCNNLPIAFLDGGLPLKGEKKVINFDVIKNEGAIRTLIAKNLAKQIHPNTKTSIDFIHTILEEAYHSGIPYDVRDLRTKVLSFAMNSTHQSEYCMTLVGKMLFCSKEVSENRQEYKTDTYIFFDVEVFPNLFVLVWKPAGQNKCIKMINPTPQEIEEILKFKLIGFNCRRYDNHILYGRLIGYNNYQLFELSKRIIGESRSAFFGEAYNISYTDVYDFASAANKKSLKKFEIELGIHHQELHFSWDQDVPEDKWFSVADYCENDVIATEKVFEHLSGDWAARQILAELSGLSVNDTTNQHSTKIIFGDNKTPQDQFVYTNLADIFPGYSFIDGKSNYLGEDPGEGGYVYSEPGSYNNVAVLDVASMHPTSIVALNLFGPYTQIFADIRDARLAIKHNDRVKLEQILNGRLIPFVEKADRGEFSLGNLSTALKTVINSVYGLTSAHFPNAFKDPRNIDNIVAKRGALFMIALKKAVQEKGFKVCHIKTDSIKIPDATPEIIQFVLDFGEEYNYTFELEGSIEGTYDKFCLVNDAVYIARYKTGKNIGQWTAVGAQFSHPYVFKTLFSKEPILFEDMCETKAVTSALYLDMNEQLQEGEHNYCFVGKVGSFCPILAGHGGGVLLREKDGKYNSATGTKGFRWLEAELVKVLQKEESVDRAYFRLLIDEAIDDISKFVDFDSFIS